MVREPMVALHDISFSGFESQWRSQKFGLGGAVGQFWLKSLINIEFLDTKRLKLHSI